MGERRGREIAKEPMKMMRRGKGPGYRRKEIEPRLMGKGAGHEIMGKSERK
jgi:hypothetical protein